MTGVVLGRRALLAGGAVCLLPAPAAAAPEFDVEELALERARNLPRRCALVVPRTPAAPGSLPLLVLLHGLGETRDERAGLGAWLGPYGLRRAWARLAAPPVAREAHAYVSEAELSALNASVEARPFQGLVIACPFLPHASASGLAGITRYARWLKETLLPALRERAGAASREVSATGIAGVSLGGYVALEAFLAEPSLFGSLGTVQGAFGAERAALYARRLAELGGARPPAVFVSTSTADPYRRANERLYRELEARGVPSRLSIRRGPHSQGWLREIGSLEMLLWWDRALRGAVESGEVRAA